MKISGHAGPGPLEHVQAFGFPYRMRTMQNPRRNGATSSDGHRARTHRGRWGMGNKGSSVGLRSRSPGSHAPAPAGISGGQTYAVRDARMLAGSAGARRIQWRVLSALQRSGPLTPSGRHPSW